MNRILHVVVFTGICLAPYISYAQDTVVVVLSRWKITDKPRMGSCKVRNDTIFVARGGTTRYETHSEREYYVQLRSGEKYYLFYDKRGRRMMEGYLSGEGFYNSFIFYYKNGEIKIKGNIGLNGNCGEWEYFNKKGELKKTKKFDNCQ